MQDITRLSLDDKSEIAEYIKRDNLKIVNEKVRTVNVKNTIYTRYIKRVFDIIIAIIMLIITLPINFVIAVITYFDVGSPILFRQQRIGKNEKKFYIYKFRNMTNEVDSNGKLLPPSMRVTKWGKFVRKTSLDELLNFVSILNGSMSVVGPRPLLDYYAQRLNDRHKAIFMVKPGLECPMISKSDNPISWQERLDYYVWYVENCSFFVDVKIVFQIFVAVFDKKEAKRRAGSTQGGLLGYDKEGNVIYTKTVPDVYVKEFCKNHGFENLKKAIEYRNMGEE